MLLTMPELYAAYYHGQGVFYPVHNSVYSNTQSLTIVFRRAIERLALEDGEGYAEQTDFAQGPTRLS